MFIKEINPETLKLIFASAAKMANKYISRKFEMIDTDKETKEHTGFVSF
jgi:hypothetical protein